MITSAINKWISKIRSCNRTDVRVAKLYPGAPPYYMNLIG